MSDPRSSLSVIYFDPEAVPVPEPEPIPEPPKRRGRPPGSKTVKPKAKRLIPWFNIWRSTFWSSASIVSVVSLYSGVQGWLGQSIAQITLAVSVLVAAFLLDRDWKKMRTPR